MKNVSMNAQPPLQIKVGLRVAKPANEVFEAIADPEKMRHYFIAKGSGRMDQNTTVEWTFPEMEAAFPVQIKKVEKDSYISFAWNDIDGSETIVAITLQPVIENITFVTVTEGEKKCRKTVYAG